MNATLTTSAVTIDGMLTVTATYDPVNRWNGWIAAPLMTRGEAEKVVAWFNAGAEEGDSMRFDESGALQYQTQDETPEVIRANDGGLYDLGLGLGWVWSEAV